MPIHKLDSEIVRRDWRQVLETVGSGTHDVVVVQEGRAAAALIPYADYLALRDALVKLRANRSSGLDALATDSSMERLRWEEELAGDEDGDGDGGGDGGGDGED